MHVLILVLLSTAGVKRPTSVACGTAVSGSGFRAAIASGDVAAVKRSLASNMPIDCWFSGGVETPLGVAVQEGQIEIVRVLLEAGGDASFTATTRALPPLLLVFAKPMSRMDKTPAEKAALADLLIAKGANPKTEFSMGAVKTSIASQAARFELADLDLALKRLGADPLKCDSDGTCPIERAVLDALAPFDHAADVATVAKIDLLISAGALPPTDATKGERLLMTAVQRCWPVTFARLDRAGLGFQKGAAKAVDALALAAGCGDDKIFDAALAAGATPTAKPGLLLAALTQLHARPPAGSSDPRLIADLLNAGADWKTPDVLGRTPLMLVAGSGALAVFDVVAQFDKRFDAVDSAGHSLAYHAAAGGNPAILGRVKVSLHDAATPALLPLAGAADAFATSTVDALLAGHDYSPEILSTIARETFSKRFSCTATAEESARALTVLTRLVEHGANPLAMRERLVCRPDFDKALVFAAERFAKKQAQGTAQMLLLLWDDSYKKLAPIIETWLSAGDGFPKKVGDVTALAACPENELKPHLKAWLALNPKAMVRSVDWPQNARACPWSLSGVSPLRKSETSVINGAQVTIAVFQANGKRVYTVTAVDGGGRLKSAAHVVDSSYATSCDPRSHDYDEVVAWHPTPRLALSCRPKGGGAAMMNDVYKVDVSDLAAVRIEHQ